MFVSHIFSAVGTMLIYLLYFFSFISTVIEDLSLSYLIALASKPRKLVKMLRMVKCMFSKLKNAIINKPREEI